MKVFTLAMRNFLDGVCLISLKTPDIFEISPVCFNFTASTMQDNCIKCGKSFVPNQSSPKRVCTQCLKVKPDDAENGPKKRRITDFSISRLTETTPRKSSSFTPYRPNKSPGSEGQSPFPSPEFLHSSPYSPKLIPPPFGHSLLSPLQQTNVLANTVHFSHALMSPFHPRFFQSRGTGSLPKPLFGNDLSPGSETSFSRVPWSGSLSHHQGFWSDLQLYLYVYVWENYIITYMYLHYCNAVHALCTLYASDNYLSLIFYFVFLNFYLYIVPR